MIRPPYRYKTEPRGKQLEVLEQTWSRPSLAFLCRPGTGKTKLGLDTAGLNFMSDRIDALIVIAPEGVDRQWIEEGVPKHLSDDVPRVCGNYTSSMGKLAFTSLERVMLGKPGKRVLRMLTISFDGLQTARGKKLANDMTKKLRCMTIDDESHRTSNHKSDVWKAVRPVMRASRVKRIATGTLIRQNPFSAWGQFELMGDGLLGFPTLAGFKSMYAQMLPEKDRLVQLIIQKNIPKKWVTNATTGQREQVPRFIPQIQAKDEDERPIYRNLADLRKRLAQHAVFLTLADVNGKEPVVNETPRFVTLNHDQQALYDDMVRYGVAQAPGGQLTAEGALALSIRLAQIAGGHAPCDDDWTAQAVGPTNPKLDELLYLIDELGDEKLVIWCKFTPEIRTVVAALTAQYGAKAVVEYHGRMSGSLKDASKLAFINDPTTKFFVGQQKAGGTGLDGLQGVAHYMAFYSNDYSALERLQAISRLARTDGADTVQVWDLIAQHTIDEEVVRCLRNAQDVSEAVLARAIVRVWE